VVPSFGNPYQRLIDMRGFGLESGYQNVVISVDGRRLNDIDSLPQFLGAIPLSSIERVEIVRGAGSVAGGDGAMAGTINVVTREYSGASAQAYGGTYGQFGGGVSLGRSGERYSVTVDAVHDQRDGLAERDRRGQRDDKRLDSLNARGRLRPTDWLEVRAGVSGFDSRVIYREAIPRGLTLSRPNANAGVFGVYNRQESNGLRGDLGFVANLGGGLSLEYERGYEGKIYAFDSAFGASTSDYGYYNDRALLQWSVGRLVLLGGYESRQGSRDLRSAFGDSSVSRDAEGFLAEGTLRAGAATFSAGVRRERIDYAFSGSATSLASSDQLLLWNLGTSYRFDPRLYAFGSFARGGQAPDVDRFFAFDFSQTPARPTFNGFIRPARSDTVTAGARLVLPDTRVDLSVFAARLRDEIYTDPVTFTNTNLDRSHKYGVELQAVHDLTDAVQGRLAWTWTRALVDREAADPATGQPAIRDRELPGVPRHGITAGLDWAIDSATRLNVSQIWRSSAWAISDFQNDGLRQRPYRLTNALLTHQLDQHWQAFVAADNLFEARNALYVNTPFGVTPAVNGGYGYPSDYQRLWRFGVRAVF
jgi:iron complex outermembrane receptor protein